MNLRYRFKTKPWSHQKKALSRMVKLQGRGGLFMDMATGKSKVAIDYVGLGFYNWNVRRVLVICPVNALPVWPQQLERHAPYPYRVLQLQGLTTREKLAALREKEWDPNVCEWVVLNYESSWRSVGKSKMEDYLFRCHFDVIIFDEAHRLKTASSRQSRAGARIASHIKERLLLTGTPQAKNTLDYYGEFRAVDEKIFPMSWTNFRYYYALWGSGARRFMMLKLLHVDEISKIVRAHSFRVLKKDCLDLPPKVSVVVPVTLSAPSMKLYKEMAKDAIIEVEGAAVTAPIVLTKVLRLQQITSGFTKDVEGKIHVIGHEKLDVCMDLLEDALDNDQKVVIYCRFIQDISILAKALAAKHIGFRILSGTVPPEDRDSLRRDFQEKAEVKVFVAQIASGSEAIDLTAGNVVIYYSLTDTAFKYWQSRDRVHRPGQTKPVTYYHLVVPHSVDTTMLKNLKSKETLAHAVLHNPRLLLGGEIGDISLDT